MSRMVVTNLVLPFPEHFIRNKNVLFIPERGWEIVTSLWIFRFCWAKTFKSI